MIICCNTDSSVYYNRVIFYADNTKKEEASLALFIQFYPSHT